MRKLTTIFTAVMFVSLAAALPNAPTLLSQEQLARARRINAEAMGVDSHIDTIQRVLNGGEDILQRTKKGHVDLPRLMESGMRAPFFALYVPTYYKGSEAVRRTLQLRDAMQRVLDANPGQIELALTATDIERIVRAGKISAVLTIESGHAIADDLAVLRMFHRLGVRSMTLTHFRNTNWADSSTDKPQFNGLSEFGREVVREMNRIGMIVDISHVSDKTFYDTLAVTTKPVIASHSSCRALVDVPRNMTDEMIRALAKNGGVIGINFGASFLSQKDVEASRRGFAARAAVEPNLTGRALDEFAAKDYLDTYTVMRPNLATIEDAVAHIDHVVKLVGIDHAGIGSDWDGISTVPAGLEDVSKMPALTAMLLQRGYSERDVKKILGGNFLRVLRQVIGQ
ncbi:MAG: dipeptidase [Acidobacteria bacterium]|nr:dipeptidase [Acidobacteriota bacterium]